MEKLIEVLQGIFQAVFEKKVMLIEVVRLRFPQYAKEDDGLDCLPQA
jgi:hypothetical protein